MQDLQSACPAFNLIKQPFWGLYYSSCCSAGISLPLKAILFLAVYKHFFLAVLIDPLLVLRAIVFCTTLSSAAWLPSCLKSVD